MLHSFSLSNFRSFRQRVEVSLALADNASLNGWDRIAPSGQRLTTALAILGANASGKTSLIQALAFLSWFVPSSFNTKPDADIPVTPHFAGVDAPTEFEVVADAGAPETLWRYRLTVNTRQVLFESLEQKTRRGRWHPLFTRKLTHEGKYEVSQDGFGLDQTQAELVRRNVSLVSWGAQFGVTLAGSVANLRALSNIDSDGKDWLPLGTPINFFARFYAQNAQLQTRMRDLLSRWDLGLSDVIVREETTLSPSGEKNPGWFAFGVHQDSKDGTEYLLPFSHESSGTRAAFTLLARVLFALERGALVIWDELESGLHPHMLEPLLDLFSNSETNPHGAQIIFTCHAVEVLKLLQKSQIILVEKDGLESSAWRLDSLEGVRSDDNRVAKYLAGAYGAVPRL
jgi:hypothetical protein